ncbi:hypothetical protein M5689_014787 [Euphorbia peplus]|nr:hypothetical protein M5689_014787 [Euphorbia peplus]
MAVSSETKKAGGGSELGEVLKPFYERASEAEDRLSRLEAALANDEGTKNGELLKRIIELQSKLESAQAKLELEQEKAKKLSTENSKLQYRVLHLVRAVREGQNEVEKL